MTTATNNAAYYLCASIYHGCDQNLLNNGDNIRITTAPIYSEDEQSMIRNDWGCAQYGPFATLEEARAEMVRIFGPCREIEYDDPEYNAIVEEAYAAGQYYTLSRAEAGEVIDQFPAADMTDTEIREEAEAVLQWMHSEGEHCDLDDIEEILTERRNREREMAED